MSLISQWLEVLIKPKRVLADEKNNASLKKTLAGVFVAIILLLFYLISFFYTNMASNLFKPPQPNNINEGVGYGLAEALGNAVLAMTFFLLFVIIPLIIYPLMFIFAGGLFYIFGLIVYRKGGNKLKTQYYLFSLFQPGLILLSIVFGLVFSLLSISVAWPVLIIFIYSLYLDLKATQINFNAM
jgi:hypothetical protein